MRVKVCMDSYYIYVIHRWRIIRLSYRLYFPFAASVYMYGENIQVLESKFIVITGRYSDKVLLTSQY